MVIMYSKEMVQIGSNFSTDPFYMILVEMLLLVFNKLLKTG